MQTLTNERLENQNPGYTASIKPELLIKLETNCGQDDIQNSNALFVVGMVKRFFSMIKQFWVSYCELNRLFVKYHTLSHYAKDVNRQAVN